MIRVSAIRFFSVVSPVPVYLRVAFAGATVFGASMLWLNAAEIDSALGVVLLLQMFAVSNGYSAGARRGWFDPLLVSGTTRRAIAVSNLAASSLPGVLAWFALGLVETAARHGAWPAALSSQRLTALAVVTAVSWSAGLSLPRMGAAVLWIAGLIALASTRALLPQMVSLHTAPRLSADVAADVAAFAVCPFLLLSDVAAVRAPLVIGPVFGLAFAAAAAGVAWASRRDVPLGCPS